MLYNYNKQRNKGNTMTYIVSKTTPSGGEAYLVERKQRVSMATPAYRWAKRSVKEAAQLTYDAARKAAQRYHGVFVKN
jgi:hypothetical protein